MKRSLKIFCCSQHIRLASEALTSLPTGSSGAGRPRSPQPGLSAVSGPRVPHGVCAEGACYPLSVHCSGLSALTSQAGFSPSLPVMHLTVTLEVTLWLSGSWELWGGCCVELIGGGDGGRCPGGGNLRDTSRRGRACTPPVVGLQASALVIDTQA